MMSLRKPDHVVDLMHITFAGFSLVPPIPYPLGALDYVERGS
jgi:hypothetical protein